MKLTDVLTGREFYRIGLYDKFRAGHIDLYETMTNQRRYATRARKLPKLYGQL